MERTEIILKYDKLNYKDFDEGINILNNLLGNNDFKIINPIGFHGKIVSANGNVSKAQADNPSNVNEYEISISHIKKVEIHCKQGSNFEDITEHVAMLEKLIKRAFE